MLTHKITRPHVETAWRPIETAPRDGTRFLWCWDAGPRMVLRWRQEVIRWPEYKECFDEGHWMPLPEPPK